MPRESTYLGVTADPARDADRGRARRVDSELRGAAVARAIAWIAGAEIAGIVEAGECHRGEARDVKAFARTMLIIGRIARRRGEP